MALATKSDDLNQSLQTHMVEEENQLCRLSSDLHVHTYHTHTHTHIHIHTHKYNKIISLKFHTIYELSFIMYIVLVRLCF